MDVVQLGIARQCPPWISGRANVRCNSDDRFQAEPPSPVRLDRIPPDRLVSRKDREPVAGALRDEYAIERIGVDERQLGYLQHVIESYLEDRKARYLKLLINEPFWRIIELQSADTMLDRYLPCRDRAEIYRDRRVFNDIASAIRKLRIVGYPPEKRVRVE